LVNDTDRVENVVSTTDQGDFTTLESNSIPDHFVGMFPSTANPFFFSEVDASYVYSNVPELTDTATSQRIFGVTTQGVKLAPSTAETYNGEGEWTYEALTPSNAEGSDGFGYLGSDRNNAHIQPNGQYHYHGMMESLVNDAGEAYGDVTEMILGGYAADGFPFYLRYGHSDPDDASSALVVIEASYELRSGTRASGPGGIYDGIFTEDFEFVDGSGDLDECGGRLGVTPEYPDGIYHYYITDDFPYIPRCVWGTPDSSFDP
jgi:hypothetical protein